jgi:hypothetical protein
MKRTQYIKMAAFICISSVFVCYSYAGNPEAKPCLPDIPAVWTKIVPGATHFLGRDLVPMCSGYPTTNPTFSFFVKGGTVHNLVLYFQGGGACWNWLTCIGYPPSILPTFYPDVSDADNPALSPYGIFDLSNPSNPFKDWSFVFIPYCTGDIHRGSNDWTYQDPANPGKTWTIHHRGFDNFLVVLKWITEHFEKPHEIFVTGSSAGSYGAITGFPWIKEAYPESKVSVLGDAGMGISPELFGEYTGPIWNVQLPKWIFGKHPTNSNTEVWKRIARYYPHSKIAEFTDAWDLTQIFFYDLILQTLGLPHSGSCDSWNAQMLSTVDDKQESPNYRSYIAAGTIHTILGRPEFYTENSAGISFLDWLDAMVSNQGGTHGHGGIPWKNVECTQCKPPLTCPY